MLKSFFRYGLEVVGSGGTEFCSEVCSCAGAELLGVDAKIEAVLLRRSKHSAGFVDSEGMIVAEGVAEFCESELGDFGDEFFGDEADVVGATVFVFERDGVGR